MNQIDTLLTETAIKMGITSVKAQKDRLCWQAAGGQITFEQFDAALRELDKLEDV
jgi:hypothetical protein